MGHTIMSEWNDCYKVGDKEYHGFFTAIDSTIDQEGNQTGWVEYQADNDLFGLLQSAKRPSVIKNTTQRELMVKGLTRARQRHKKLRLLFSGGTDSWSILKLCMENKIYIDEVLCHLHSFEESPAHMQNRTNIEFLPGLKYANKFKGSLIGEIHTPMHSIEKLTQFVNDDDIRKHAPGPFLPLRSAMYFKHLQQLDYTDTGTITGLEKPELIVEKDNIYWVVMDSPTGEWMGMKNHIPLYLDKHNPELTVHMAYAMLEALPKNLLQGEYRHINWHTLDKDISKKLLDSWGLSTPRNWLNNHTMKSKTHAIAPKTTYFLKEAHRLGVNNLIEDYMSQMKHIYDRYRHLPYTVSWEDNWVSSVGRFSQRIQIEQDSFGKTQVN